MKGGIYVPTNEPMYTERDMWELYNLATGVDETMYGLSVNNPESSSMYSLYWDDARVSTMRKRITEFREKYPKLEGIFDIELETLDAYSTNISSCMKELAK